MRYLAFLLLTLILALSGCQGLEKFLAEAPRPAVAVRGVHLTGLTLDSATLVFDLAVGNPYGVPLPVSDVSYALASRGAPFLSGAARTQGTIPAGQTRVLQVPATVRFTELLSALRGVRPGAVVPYTASLTLSADAPGVGTLSLPMQQSGELPIPNLPRIELMEIQWGELNLDRATATLRLKVGNTNSFVVDLARLAAGVSLAGRPVGSATVHTSEPARLKPGEDVGLEIPLSFSPKSLGLAAINALRGREASYRLDGTLDLGTPFGPMALPFDRSGTAALKW